MNVSFYLKEAWQNSCRLVKKIRPDKESGEEDRMSAFQYGHATLELLPKFELWTAGSYNLAVDQVSAPLLPSGEGAGPAGVPAHLTHNR